MSLSSVITSGEPWDERTEQLVHELDEVGVVVEESGRCRFRVKASAAKYSVYLISLRFCSTSLIAAEVR